MRVVAVSDLHGILPPLPLADLVLLAGDICPVEDHRLRHQASWLDTEFRFWLEEIEAPVVAVAGNHDLVFQQAPGLVPDLPWTYLQDSEATIAGLRIYGTPWQPTFFDWAFNAEEDELSEIWSRIPEKVDILLLHGPPHGYGDWSNYQRTRTGSPSLMRRILQVKPRLAV